MQIGLEAESRGCREICKGGDGQAAEASDEDLWRTDFNVEEICGGVKARVERMSRCRHLYFLSQGSSAREAKMHSQSLSNERTCASKWRGKMGVNSTERPCDFTGGASEAR